MTREHTKIKVLLVCLWHSNVSAPSARQQVSQTQTEARSRAELLLSEYRGRRDAIN